MHQALRFAFRLAVALLALAAVFSRPANAQCASQWDVDGTCGLNGPIWRSTMWDQDGAGPLTPRLVVAGSFSATAYGGPSLPNVAAFDPQTRTWTGLSGMGQFVEAMCANAQGQLFLAVGQQVYRWADPSWQPLGTGMNGNVTGLVALANGDVLAAGAFTTAGGGAAVGFARWNGSAWSSTGLGVSAVGRTLALAPNGNVLASGRFTIGGVPSERVARWDGLFWNVIGGAFDAPVTRLLAVTNADFVAAGTFTAVGGAPANRIARWGGTSWQQVGAGLDAEPYALAVDGAEFVVGGAFSSLGGTPVGYLARWNGLSWQAYREGMSGPVREFARLPSGDLVAVGDFTVADRVTVYYLARWDGQRWQCMGQGRQPLPVSDVRAVLPAADGKTIVGGPFVQGNGLNYIGQFDGTSWQAMESGLNGQVRALIRLPNGDVLAGGDFTATYNGATSLPYVARWDGTAWSAFGAPGGSVYAFAQRDNGDLFVAGYSSSYGWCAQQWNGTSWQVLGSGANNTTRALAFAPNGDLLMGGDFSSVGGVGTGSLARWDGTTWSSFANYQNNVGSYVASIGVASNGSIYVGGNPQYGLSIYRWDGAAWTTVGGFYNGYSEYVVAALPNGDAVVGSTYPHSYGYLSRYSPLSGWQSFNVSGPVRALAVLGTNELHVGGSFSSTPNGQSLHVARYTASCPAQLVAAGPGCAGPNGAVILTAQPSPWVGLTCQSRATGLSTNAFAFVVLGVSTINLPLDSVLPIAAPGCVLVPAPDDVQTLVPFAGEVNSSLAIPNNPAIAGTTIWQQVIQFELDPLTGPLSLNASNALRLVVGVF